MTQNLWCRLLNLHKYEIIEKTVRVNHDNKDIVEGLVIVSRCTNCGKIKHSFIPTRNGQTY